jgi:hypothetical protein
MLVNDSCRHCVLTSVPWARGFNKDQHRRFLECTAQAVGAAYFTVTTARA